MLTRKQISLLDEKGISTLHDFRILSLTAGEPYLEDGVLSYFDGRLVTACGFPLRGAALIEETSLRDLSKYWIKERSAEGIIHIGPQSLDLRCLRAFSLRRVEKFRGQNFSAELMIKCNGNSDEVFKHRFYRRSCSRGFKSTVKTGGILSAEHLKLIET